MKSIILLTPTIIPAIIKLYFSIQEKNNNIFVMLHYRKVLEWDKIILVCHYIIIYFCTIQLLIEISMEQPIIE